MCQYYVFLFRFSWNIIIIAIPHSTRAGIAAWKNQAIPPATARIIPKIPMVRFCLTKLGDFVCLLLYTVVAG
jgi:hypothetical protein